MSVAAAPEFRLRHPSDDAELLATPAGRGIPDAMDEPKVLGEQDMVGHNYRMTDLQAAVGLPQLDRYDEIVAQRQANADMLNAGLADVPGIVTPRSMPGRRHVWHQYTIRITPETGTTRDSFVQKLTQAGIGCGIYYPKLVTEYETYKNRADVRIGSYPVAERMSRECVSLPVHPKLSQADLEQIVTAVTNAARA